MKVLLTGIGGSIGCHVLLHLLHNTDWQITGIDSFRHKGLTDRVEQVLSTHPEYRSRVRIFTHDLRAPLSEILIRKIGPVDYLIAMASLSDVHDSILDPVPFITSNVLLILNTLEYARKVQPRKIIITSTDEVYGPTDGKILHSEWSPVVPSNPYSGSKCAQESVAISYWRSYNVPIILINLMNNFSEMQSPSKFPAIVQRKVRRGEIVEIHANNGVIGSRCYIHSRNSADAILYLLHHVNPPLHREGQMDRPERFNIVGDRTIDNLDLAELIASYIGKPLQWVITPASTSRPGHDIHYGLDGSRLAGLGWKQPVSFEDSLRKTVQWYEEHPEWLDPR